MKSKFLLLALLLIVISLISTPVFAEDEIQTTEIISVEAQTQTATPPEQEAELEDSEQLEQSQESESQESQSEESAPAEETTGEEESHIITEEEQNPTPSTEEIQTVTIRLQIETMNGTLFDETVPVTECAEVLGSATTTLSAWCALSHIGEQQGWTVTPLIFGTDIFVSSINQYNGLDGNWWAFFYNNTFASEALNKYILSDDEHILLNYGVFPMRLTTSDTEPTLGDTVTLSAETFGFDDSFNPVWNRAADITFITNGMNQTIASGTMSLAITTTTPYSITASKNGFVSQTLLLTPTSSESVQPVTPPCTTCDSAGGGGPPTQQNIGNNQSTAIQQAIAYLVSHQQTDGGFGSLLFSDWVAMAYARFASTDAAFTQSKNRLIHYMSSPDLEGQLTTLTDYERHVLGLRALNLPADNFQQDILSTFDGTQFGSRFLINDDVFAILALDSLGCCNAQIQAAAAFVASAQNQDTGSINGSDMTAAAIRALRIVYPAEHTTIVKAQQFLKNQQQSDGRITGSVVDTDTTSWTLDALATLDQLSLSQWFTTSANTPLSYLLSSQNPNGSFGSQNPVWSTAYAILALTHNWNPIAPKESESQAQAGGGTRTNELQNATPSSSIPNTATTTLAETTSPNTPTHENTKTNTSTEFIPILNTSPSPTEETQASIPVQILSRGSRDTLVQTQRETSVEIPQEETMTQNQEYSRTNSNNEQILAPAPIITAPTRNTARDVATTATAFASSLGLYLAWRFIQTLL